MIFCHVQNEDDDWQENEELRAIEGLEGEEGPRDPDVTALKPTSSLSCAPLRRRRAAKAGLFWA